jgi:glycerophosphoryl diester phosphodiesterase
MRENPWLERRIVNFAHQGGSFEAPSSTLYAIDHGLAAGATAVELDVHATKDRQLVVCHDETVDRTTNGAGEICDLTLAELRALDNAYCFIEGSDVAPGRPSSEYAFRGMAPSDPSFGIATLDEVLERFPGVTLNLDIKRTEPQVLPYEGLLAETLAAHGRSDSVIVASFNDLAIRAFRAASPTTPTSAATMETADFWRAVHAGEEPAELDVVAFQVPERQGDLLVVDDLFVEAAHQAGIAVHVWTINDADAMERLIELEVDGIISDRPTLLADLLGEQAWDGVLTR